MKLTRSRRYFLVIAAAAAAFTAVLAGPRRDLFRPYVGEASPVLVVVGSIVLAAACLTFLRSRGAFQTLAAEHDARWLMAFTLIPTLLVIPAIAADVVLRFPRGMNVAAPESLLFYYPVIGYVAEVVFHLLPLALFLVILGPTARRPASGRLVRAGLVFAAFAEPIFQVAAGLGRQPFTVLDGFVGVHLLVYSLVALWVFRRYDFVTMYLFRLVYYAWWHIGWGSVRLTLLF